jgi:hypothetical protein
MVKQDHLVFTTPSEERSEGNDGPRPQMYGVDFTETVELSSAAHMHMLSVRRREEESLHDDTVEHDNNVLYESL